MQPRYYFGTTTTKGLTLTPSSDTSSDAEIDSERLCCTLFCNPNPFRPLMGKKPNFPLKLLRVITPERLRIASSVFHIFHHSLSTKCWCKDNRIWGPHYHDLPLLVKDCLSWFFKNWNYLLIYCGLYTKFWVSKID